MTAPREQHNAGLGAGIDAEMAAPRAEQTAQHRGVLRPHAPQPIRAHPHIASGCASLLAFRSPLAADLRRLARAQVWCLERRSADRRRSAGRRARTAPVIVA
eukprot:1283407-Prymnesium_polylepis.1